MKFCRQWLESIIASEGRGARNRIRPAVRLFESRDARRSSDPQTARPARRSAIDTRDIVLSTWSGASLKSAIDSSRMCVV